MTFERTSGSVSLPISKWRYPDQQIITRREPTKWKNVATGGTMSEIEGATLLTKTTMTARSRMFKSYPENILQFQLFSNRLVFSMPPRELLPTEQRVC